VLKRRLALPPGLKAIIDAVEQLQEAFWGFERGVKIIDKDIGVKARRVQRLI
jgi:hypothetical protein